MWSVKYPTPFLNLSIMSTCLENIIGIKAPCADAVLPISGYYITDYPGITLQSASNTADEKTLTGYNYLVDLRRRAMLRLNNDILSYINREYKVNTFISDSYKSGELILPFSTNIVGSSSQRRGTVISTRKTWCRFQKMVVNRVRIYSNYTGDTVLKISDVSAGVSYSIPIELEAGVGNEFVINKPITGREVQITLPSDIEVYKVKPECGCGGKPKNEFLEFSGLNNGVVNTSEAYGIEVDMTLKCDLSTLVCDMAHDGIIGQCAYELCGAMFYDEITKNNRLNYLTIYKSEEIKLQAQAGFEAYTNYMNSALLGMRNYLVNSDGNCGCIDCSGVKILSNV